MRTRKLIVLVTVLSLVSITQVACPGKDELIDYAQKIVSAATELQPLISSAGVRDAIEHGKALASALKAKDNAAITAAAAQLIVDLDLIEADVRAHLTGGKRTYALAVLSVADFALHYIVDHVPSETIAQVKRGNPQALAAITRIEQYRSRKRLACRNSQTGRFEKMDFCRQHPELSVVERF